MISFLKSNFKGFGFKGRLSFLAKSQNTIVAAATIIGASTGISAMLGLLKSRYLTAYFGVSDELGIFYTADKIPNLIYSALVVGALSTVFIPIFTNLLKRDKTKAWEAASTIITIGIGVFVIIGVLILIFANPLIRVLSVNKFTQQQVILGATLMRIMLIAQLILVISSFLTSILQSFRIFLYPALAPIMYNLGMLLGIVFFSPKYGIYGPTMGVLIGAIFHVAIQAPAISTIDFRYSPKLKKNKEAKKMIALLPPRVASVVLNHLVATVNNSFAILVSTSSVVLLKFAGQLQFFPVHLFGASMAAASLPVLSAQTGTEDLKKFKKIFVTTLTQMLFLVMPVSVLLLILRVPVVRLVYGVDNFPWEATIKTSYALAFFSISIFAQSSNYLLTRGVLRAKRYHNPSCSKCCVYIYKR